MFKHLLKFNFAIALALFIVGTGLAVSSFGAQAQEKMILATGDIKEGSTYAIMGDELLKHCAAGGIVPQYTKGGGSTNRELLVGNKVNMAIMQSDMLEFTRRTDAAKVAQIRTLVPLHAEEVHFIARADVKKEGGYLGTSIGAKAVTFNTLADLAGRTIGAVGGSVDSASVISNVSGLKFGVQRVNTTAELLAALQEGKFDAVAIVAGAPSAAVAGLSSAFKVLPVPKEVAQKLVDSKLYMPAKLSYENLRAVGVDTVAVQAVLATRVYRSSATVAQLKSFRECYYNKLGDIQDARGTHPKWQAVNGNLKSGWQWYEL